MINKFRYKKPPQAQTDIGGGDDSGKVCGAKKDGTLTRKDKLKHKTDIVFSGVLDNECKSRLKVSFLQVHILGRVINHRIC